MESLPIATNAGGPVPVPMVHAHRQAPPPARRVLLYNMSVYLRIVYVLTSMLHPAPHSSAGDGEWEGRIGRGRRRARRGVGRSGDAAPRCSGGEMVVGCDVLC